MRKDQGRFKFDAASALSQGGREYQEDALASDFGNDADIGFVVLSDGMGGHAAGDVASQIVVAEVFDALMFHRTRIAQDPSCVSQILRDAAAAANECLKSHVADHPEVRGMGATLVACTLIGDQLNWVSVGDSPLLLFRNDALSQLNEDHSFAPHIDFMVQSGMLTKEEGASHPERNVLTSVLAGQDDVALVDCPNAAVTVQQGDVVIVASDGLQYLSNDAICDILRDQREARSGDITDALMDALAALGDPDLDNISVSLIQIEDTLQPVLEPVLQDDSMVSPFVKRICGEACDVMTISARARARTKILNGVVHDDR